LGNLAQLPATYPSFTISQRNSIHRTGIVLPELSPHVAPCCSPGNPIKADRAISCRQSGLPGIGRGLDTVNIRDGTVRGHTTGNRRLVLLGLQGFAISLPQEPSGYHSDSDNRQSELPNSPN
jgi:hypothetical protein